MRLKDLGMSASRFWRKKEKREGMCRGRGRKRKRRDTRRKKGGAKSWKERGGGRGGRRGRRGEEEEKAEWGIRGEGGRGRGGEQDTDSCYWICWFSAFIPTRDAFTSQQEAAPVYEAGAECWQDPTWVCLFRCSLHPSCQFPGHTWLSAGWRICSVESGSWSWLDSARVSWAGNLDVKFNERLFWLTRWDRKWKAFF